MDGPGIVVATDAAERAQGVIEGAVLLHQDHDMFSVVPGAAFRRGDGQGAKDRLGQELGNAGVAALVNRAVFLRNSLLVSGMAFSGLKEAKS